MSSANGEGEEEKEYEWDLLVIGGGSGGLAAAKEAQSLGAKVALCDYVKPSPKGSKWGLGGTCVNVGCIPKKLMHTAAIYGEIARHEAEYYGWEMEKETISHNWAKMKDNVQDHIKGINWGYRVQLRSEGVSYQNKLAKFISPHTVELMNNKGKTETTTAKRILVAVGGRPTPLEIPGGDLAISSDDLFSLPEAPGKTLVVGAGYVALECAGFIHGLQRGGATVLVRSILLRGFDRDLVKLVEAHMRNMGLEFIMGATPVSIEKLPGGKLKVMYSNGGSGEYDTVLAAVGRRADTAGLALDAVGVTSDAKTGKIHVSADDATNVPHVFALGDVALGRPELTPVAILAGKLLSQRLYGRKTDIIDYSAVATTVFTPLELGTVGLTEEDAIAKYGADKVDSYMSEFVPLEWYLHEEKKGELTDENGLKPPANVCLVKVVVTKDEDEKVLGIHIACPNAGEVIQGFAVAFRMGNLKMKDLLLTVGIHPTVAEVFTTLHVTKSSGQSFAKTSC